MWINSFQHCSVFQLHASAVKSPRFDLSCSREIHVATVQSPTGVLFGSVPDEVNTAAVKSPNPFLV